MESISLLRGGSLLKLPLYAPLSSSVSMMASRLHFDDRRPSFPQLISNDSTNILNGSTHNCNTDEKFVTRCGNVHSWGETHWDAKEDPLKSLLSLVQARENNSWASVIATAKNEALKLVMDEKYDEAEWHMSDVEFHARVAHLQILIYLGEYKKALQFLEKNGNFPQSDTRLSLYKAVVHTMLGHDDKAKEWWNSYLKTTLGSNGNVVNSASSSSFVVIGAKEILEPLLNLKPAKVEPNSVLWNIIPKKNLALKEVVKGNYKAAETHMQKLCKDVMGNPEEELAAQIAYVQILIHLDKYKEALERVNEKKNYFSSSDPKPCLYKAIGLTVLGKHEDAKICWEVFMQTIGVGNRGKPQP